MILGKSTGTLTSRREHSVINSLYLSKKPIGSIYLQCIPVIISLLPISQHIYMYVHVIFMYMYM